MGFQTSVIILIILWMILSVLSSLEYIPMARELKGWSKVLFILIFMIGGPIFGINQVLTMLLDCILPEGWDNEDDLNKGH